MCKYLINADMGGENRSIYYEKTDMKATKYQCYLFHNFYNKHVTTRCKSIQTS